MPPLEKGYKYATLNGAYTPLMEAIYIYMHININFSGINSIVVG